MSPKTRAATFLAFSTSFSIKLESLGLEVDAHFEPNIGTELISFLRVEVPQTQPESVLFFVETRDTNHDAKSTYPKLYFSILLDIFFSRENL